MADIYKNVAGIRSLAVKVPPIGYLQVANVPLGERVPYRFVGLPLESVLGIRTDEDTFCNERGQVTEITPVGAYLRACVPNSILGTPYTSS